MQDFNHILEVLATSFFETVAPSRCVVCDMPGPPLCPECAADLPIISTQLACPRCGAPFGRMLCTECLMPQSEAARKHPEQLFPFIAGRAALSYESGAQKILRAYKDSDELRLDATIASFICAAIRGRVHSGRVLPAQAPIPLLHESPLPGDWALSGDAIVCVPASPEALKRRGLLFPALSEHEKKVAMK